LLLERVSPVSLCSELSHPTNDQVRKICTFESAYTLTWYGVRTFQPFVRRCIPFVHRIVRRIMYMWSRWQEAQHDPCPGMHPAESCSTGPTSTAAIITRLFSFLCAYIPHGIPTKTHCYRTPSSHTHAVWYRRKTSTSYPRLYLQSRQQTHAR
jgi:hypothetical protein